MTQLSIEHVSVTFGAKPILRDITASLGGGGLIGLIGPNGAGKSTLIRTIVRLVDAEGGRIAIDGTDISAMARRDLARKVAYLPQSHDVHWPLDSFQLVALGRLPHLTRFSELSPGDDEAVRAALRTTDATAFADRLVPTLSGGERARVLLARALAIGAPILLVDEPVTSLDPFHQLQIMELLRDIAHEGRLVVAVLHDLPLAARFCTRLLLLDGGKLIADGAPDTVLSQNNLRASYRVDGVYGSEAGEPYVLPWHRLS